jgi:cell division septation protein DedD
MPNNEPRKIRTLAVKGDAAENGGAPAPVAAPATKPAAAARTATAPAAAPPAAARNPASANASAPLSLAPGGAQPDSAPPPTRTAATTPTQTAPAPSAGGGYVVQISSQKSEADAQASFRALQGKFPAVLGSRSPLIKRADLGEKGVYYRAMVGPFGSPDEASQFCGNLKTAGGQCVVQRN